MAKVKCVVVNNVNYYRHISQKVYL